MLRRHQKWPPSSFSSLSEVQQQQFFVACQKQKEESKKSMFSYKSIRDTLISSLAEEKINQKKVETGGTYLPVSVYEARGYKCDEGFKARNPKMWSYGLNEWTFLLAETSVNEAEIKNTIERQIVEAERQVRKRKAVEVEPHEEIANAEKRSTVTDKTEVLDLISDSEDEGAEAKGAANKKLTPKQLEAKMKREADKITKEEKAASQKEESHRKRLLKAVTKKTVSLSSKLSIPLAEALHKASDVMQKAIAEGLEEHDHVKSFKDEMKVIEEYKVKCTQALAFYSKNPNCELSSLPFDNEKQVTTMLKDLAKKGSDIKKNISQARKNKK
ncbi:unnamed protein product [Cladocopium goreaui]|uniref:Uncharacterized protein n=1 Tax=Cladocopium goreaui TaxID=2562237 RepID=A0A9P1CKJ6_9DINO|nr:unnamed protein product [Cladocopium goreaui]